MSGTNEPPNQSSGSAMADHLKRYRDYINDLKSGQSSGISAAFGRASDLLPPEVMEIKAPKINRPSGELLELGDRVLATEYDHEYLRQTVETMVQTYANDLEDAVGCIVNTSGGTEEVLSCYIENGERMFMLSDLSVIDEETFRHCMVGSETEDQLSDSSLDSLDEVDSSQLESLDETDRSLFDSSDISDNQLPSDELDGLAQTSYTGCSTAADDSGSMAESMQNLGSLTFGALAQSVTTPEGALLWQIYYNNDGPELVSMSDGGIIKRAEGRHDYVFSKLSAMDGDIKFFILTGFIVDPSTGNVYLEANEGAYTAAFFNNGWRIHQYRNHEGEETYYATEPARPDRAPITTEVKNLNLDLATGEVSYDTIDSAASVTLKSRKL